MSKAFQFMSNRHKSNSHSYEIAKKAVRDDMIGNTHSQETKDRISKSLQGTACSEDKKRAIGDKNSKAVAQYDLNGIFIREFKSAAEAARTLGINKSNVSQVCLGYRKTCFKSIWKFI